MFIAFEVSAVHEWALVLAEQGGVRCKCLVVAKSKKGVRGKMRRNLPNSKRREVHVHGVYSACTALS